MRYANWASGFARRSRRGLGMDRMERQIKAGSGFRSHKALYWLAGSLIVLAVAGQILILRGVVFRHRLAAFERESQWLLTVGDRLLNGYLEVQQARLEYLTATAARPDI